MPAAFVEVTAAPVFVSHPSVSLLALQSLHVAAHGLLQTPLAHDRDDTLLPEHLYVLWPTGVHPPQLSGSVVGLISHPSDSLLALQSRYGTVHVPLQVPDPQVRVAMLLDEQTLPHPPQWLASLVTVVSQPSVCLLLLQSAEPPLHVPLHAPDPHVRVAMWLFEQTIPQALQLSGSVRPSFSHPFVSLSVSQSRKPAVHVPLHVPSEQVLVAMLFDEQTVPQELQLSALAARFVSQPSFALWLQSAVL
jgi:hypothetical protein